MRGGERKVAPRSRPGLPVAILRVAVERELASVSLRQAARETGLSPNALRNFVRGAHPRTTTRARLEQWLAGRRGRGRGPSPGAFARLLSDVTPDLSSRDAAELGRELSRLIVDAYRRQQVPPPRWVRELVQHYRANRA